MGEPGGGWRCALALDRKWNKLARACGKTSTLLTGGEVPNCMRSKTPVPSGFLPRKHLGVEFVEDSSGDSRKMGHLTCLWQGRSSR